MLIMSSCYSCGKIAADNGEATLSQCSKCKRAWYCNVVGWMSISTVMWQDFG